MVWKKSRASTSGKPHQAWHHPVDWLHRCVLGINSMAKSFFATLKTGDLSPCGMVWPMSSKARRWIGARAQTIDNWMMLPRLPDLLRPQWSVRVRILAVIMAVTALGMVVAGGTAFLVQRDRVLHEVDGRLLASVEAVRVVVSGSPGAEPSGSAVIPESAGFANPKDALAAALARVLPSRYESSVGIVNGVPAYVSAADVLFHLEDDPVFIDRVVTEVSDGSVRMGTAVSELGNLRYIATPVTVEGVTDVGVFVTAFDLDAELGEVTTAFSTYSWVAAIALLAIGLVGWFVAGRLLLPIRHLREAASRITASDLQERIPVRGNDDVSALTSTVNEMLDRIRDSLTSQRQLLDDIRHELKTPLTIVRGHLELVDSTNADEVEQARALVIDELDRMADLVDDIESLADSQKATLKRKETDVAELGRQVFAKASSIPGQAWSLDEGYNGSAWLDPARITQAWLQLADNAAKYSEDGTQIVLGTRQSDGMVEFWVADQGPGIPAGLEKRIFERFGRIDTGRGIHGSGLGLAIVEAIARSHGGRVTLTTSPLGSRFGIEVPVRDTTEEP